MKIFAGVPNINFMSQRKVGLWVSAVLTVASILLLVFRGLNFGIDFTGGVLVEVHYPKTIELEVVREKLTQANYHSPIVQYFGTKSDVLIRLPPTAETNSAKVSSDILNTLGLTEANLRRIEFVGPQVGEELTHDGALALLLAFIGIAIYIMFRFEWKFSIGAVAALTHDALMVLGFLSLTWIEFDLTTVAAILALIGYSNNETIVIFDRVRENLIDQRKQDIYEVVNLSVNQTLLRSVITHVTTLIVLVALFVAGGTAVHSFSAALIVGVIVATYSSIYVSTGLAVVLGITREDLVPTEKEQIDELP